MPTSMQMPVHLGTCPGTEALVSTPLVDSQIECFCAGGVHESLQGLAHDARMCCAEISS